MVKMWVKIQREDFDLAREVEGVKASSPRIGGTVTFLGTVRDFSRGMEVSRLVFEHYPSMAEKKLEELRQKALVNFDVLQVSIAHRYGELEIGDNIVLIVVGAEHREDAFKACKFCIDELKKFVPIWKKEYTEHGGVWIEEHP